MTKLIAPHADHDDHGGLARDLTEIGRRHDRRHLLRLLGAGSALALSAGARAASCSLTPTETNGPYPADGSNSASGGGGPGGPGGPGGGGSSGTTVNALMLSGIVRRDIRTSVAGASGVAAGLPLTVRVNLVNTNGGCGRLAGYAVYIWHCTRDGLYSLYSTGVTGENYLRGVQATNSDGVAVFQTIFPGCYLGRMPHIHFEVYRSLTTATSFSNALLTSQMAFPESTCTNVYTNADGYSSSLSNLGQISFATDNVFSDGYSTQLLTMGGNTSSGMTATLKVGIAV